MIGYWDPKCPVKTDHKDILATVFYKRGKTLVALASWADAPQKCRLRIDWRTLGLDPKKEASMRPKSNTFQPAARAAINEAIPVMPGRGWLLLLDGEKHEAPSFQNPRSARSKRTLLLHELGDDWKRSVSSNSAVSLQMTNDTIAITAPANCFAFVERTLPANSGLGECQVFSGTDAGATWGPGMALVWKNNKTARINLRTNQSFGVDSGGGQGLVGKVVPNTWYHIRFRWEKDQLALEVSTDAKLIAVASFPRNQFEGDPIAVRLGKMNGSSEPVDFSPVGAVGTSAIKEFRIYGACTEIVR